MTDNCPICGRELSCLCGGYIPCSECRERNKKIAELETELKEYKECADTEANEFDELKLLAERLAEDDDKYIELLKEAKNALLCPADTDTLACGCKMCLVRRKIEKILEV